MRLHARTEGSAEQAQVQSYEYVFMTGIMFVCHSHGKVCLWPPRSRKLVLTIYVCLRFLENMPTHAPHFRGV